MSYGMDGWNHNNDLVRRKDVMDSLVKEYNRRFSLGERNGLHLAWIEKAVNEVDVAQPDHIAEVGKMIDLISRAAAIEALDDYILDDVTDSHGDSVREILERLPAVQSKPKTGKWLIRKFGDDGKCSVCGMYCGGYDLEGSDRYCRCCGAKMEGLQVDK